MELPPSLSWAQGTGLSLRKRLPTALWGGITST